MYIGSDPDVIGKGTKVGIEDVSAKIQEITECLVGKENPGGVSDAPIHLKVMRRDSPTLTLIDLPGLAYMSADEGQASTIYEQTAGLVRKYAQSEENSKSCCSVVCPMNVHPLIARFFVSSRPKVKRIVRHAAVLFARWMSTHSLQIRLFPAPWPHCLSSELVHMCKHWHRLEV